MQKCQYQDNETILIALEKALMAATKVNVTSGCLWLVLVSVGKVDLGIVSTWSFKLLSVQVISGLM